MCKKGQRRKKRESERTDEAGSQTARLHKKRVRDKTDKARKAAASPDPLYTSIPSLIWHHTYSIVTA